MKLSHSKLSSILTCPMSYYLSYEMGISPKDEKPALAIGSAVHWGIEHNTEDLTEYYKDKGLFKNKDSYTKDQLLSEAMIHGYLKHKNDIFDKLLTYKGEKLTLVEESHELYVNAKLKSFLYQNDHDFVGIIDLLLLTNKGFIIVDYKTSSMIPDWNNYLEQIYKYIFLLKSNFPEIPILKIAIINIRKTGIRQKKSENTSEFFNRLKFEYELNDEEYVNYHEYAESDIDKQLLDDYIRNLSKMADTAQMITDSKTYYINFGAAVSQYGKSQYYDIFYKTPNAEVLYKISDTIFDEDENALLSSRDCVDIDMQCIDKKNILNKFELFKSERQSHLDFDKSKFELYLKLKYVTNDELLKKYWLTFSHI